MLATPCDAPLASGLSVPAPIVFRTSCGGFRLSTDGVVVRLPRGWFGSHAYGTGRRYGADLQVRRTRSGSFRLLSHGRLVWRSSGLYPNDGGSVAFGPGEFAFGTYRQGVFLTDLEGRERLVVPGRGRFPIDFARSGRLLVGGSGRLEIVSPGGAVVRRYRYRGVNGFQFDERTDTLFFRHARRQARGRERVARPPAAKPAGRPG
ncbi:MAG TPA: hypothetical protein VFA66_11410 [Gaiellaceae bacterium]|nr:hypothetical protein [Gaiellaceae bacterium]